MNPGTTCRASRCNPGGSPTIIIPLTPERGGGSIDLGLLLSGLYGHEDGPRRNAQLGGIWDDYITTDKKARW